MNPFNIHGRGGKQTRWGLLHELEKIKRRVEKGPLLLVTFGYPLNFTFFLLCKWSIFDTLNKRGYTVLQYRVHDREIGKLRSQSIIGEWFVGRTIREMCNAQGQEKLG